MAGRLRCIKWQRKMQEQENPLVTELLRLFSSLRQDRGLTQEELADRAGIHRTYLGLLERQERAPTVGVAIALANALGYSLAEMLQEAELVVSKKVSEAAIIRAERARRPKSSCIRNADRLEQFSGFTGDMLLQAIDNTYRTLDTIDRQLMAKGSPPIGKLVELANLSSMVGNLVGAALAASSDGLYERNKPHHYPDLIPLGKHTIDLEVKMALETNRPKGHLPKPGNYVTFRYVLGDRMGNFARGKEKRGDTVWIWEVKIGHVAEADFDISNTDGDSGKTAVVKTARFNAMTLVYYDPNYLAYARSATGNGYVGFN